MKADSTGQSAGIHGRPYLVILTLLALTSCVVYGAVALLSRRFTTEIDFPQRPILAVLALLGVAFACYLAAIWAAVRAREDRRLLWLIVLSGVAFRVIMLPSRPIQEIDIYRYLWDGEVAAHGVSPFRYSPQQVLDAWPEENLPEDLGRLVELRESSPAMTTILETVHYGELPTIYPPVSQAVFAASALITPRDATVLQRIVTMKACLVVFDLATLAVVIGLLRSVGQHVGWSVVYGWCPLVIKEIANSGHLDAVAVFFTTLAVAVVMRGLFHRGVFCRSSRAIGRMTLGAGLLALAVGAKLYPAVLVPWFAAVWIRQLGWRRAAIPAVAFATIATAVLWPMFPRETLSPSAAVANEASVSPVIVPQDPSSGLKAFLGRWEINDFLFMLLFENVRSQESTPRGQRPWFSVVPDTWRVGLLEAPAAWLQVDLESAARLLCRLAIGGLFLAVALALAYCAGRSDSAADWLRAAMLTLAWFWLLSPTQNPWYWIWVMPLVPFARSKAWLAVSGLALIYYLRFWLGYHWPSDAHPAQLVPGTSYHGELFFDYVVTCLEFGPWLVWLAIDGWLAAERSEAPVRRYWGTAALCPSHPPNSGEFGNDT